MVSRLLIRIARTRETSAGINRRGGSPEASGKQRLEMDNNIKV